MPAVAAVTRNVTPLEPVGTKASVFAVPTIGDTIVTAVALIVLPVVRVAVAADAPEFGVTVMVVVVAAEFDAVNVAAVAPLMEPPAALVAPPATSVAVALLLLSVYDWAGIAGVVAPLAAPKSVGRPAESVAAIA